MSGIFILIDYMYGGGDTGW